MVSTTEVINNDANLGYKNGPSTSDPNNEVWHVGLPHTQKTEELTGLIHTDTSRATAASLLEDIDGDGGSKPAATTIAFETAPTGGTTRELRRLSEQRVRYFNDAGTGANSFGTPGLRAIPHQRFLLAVTSGLFSDVYGTATTLTIANLRTQGGYVELATDGHAWVASGVLTLDTLAFFVPTTHTDAFGNDTSVTWDDDSLAVLTLTDAKSNVTTATTDYRTLSPSSVEDPNGTVSEVETDALGRVVASIVYNDSTATTYGDTSLSDPTTRFTYTTSTIPNSVKVEAREEHGGTAVYQESHAYLDGSGAAVQTKSQVAPGDAPERDTNGDLVFDGSGDLQWTHADPRWVGSGRVIVDNKGNVVKKYEPFFSDTSDFEDEKDIAEWGVSPVFSFDPIGRNTLVTLPDGHTRSFVFSPWEVHAFDECDNESGGDHENTPSITHLDAMGRVVQVWELLDTDWLDSRDDPTPANRIDPTTDDGVLRTRIAFDVSGNPHTVTDARDNDIQVQTHDLLGRPLFTGSADEGFGTVTGAGERRVALDVAGQPLQSWRSGGLITVVTHDELRRPVQQQVTLGGTTRTVEYRVYGDAFSSGVPTFSKGRLWRVYDTAGMHELAVFDFKGTPTTEERTVVDDMKTDVNWSTITSATTVSALDSAVATSNILDATTHSLVRTVDALGRQLTETAPDGSITTPTYDEGNRLVGQTVRIQGETTVTQFIDGITYNARGQRLTLVQGDASGAHTTTTYTYDPNRFWVTDIETQRSTDTTGELLQDLGYTRDACGNITAIEDDAQETFYFDNAQVTPKRTFEYDALYRLTKATGREKTSRGQPGYQIPTSGGLPDNGAINTVLKNYEQRYVYDKAGNITQMQHLLGANTDWRRGYHYEALNNQLISTSLPGDTWDDPTTHSEVYTYNDRGAMTELPHLPTTSGTPNVTRDFRDHIRHMDLDTSGNEAWYVYDAGGQRVAKRVESPDTRIRLYLWGYELYREYDSGGSVAKEWSVLHVMDDQRRVALVETQTVGGSDKFLRFQFTDHLGTAAVECDGHDGMSIISYEEYHPYGTSAWWAEKSALDVSPKRYRFTGMERDDETGMQYHSQRYYMPWLGRWERADPIGLGDGGNRFGYAGGNPVTRSDALGSSWFDEVSTRAVEFQNDVSAAVSDMVDGAVAAARDPVGTFVRATPAAKAAGAYLESRNAGGSTAQSVGAGLATLGASTATALYSQTAKPLVDAAGTGQNLLRAGIWVASGQALPDVTTMSMEGGPEIARDLVDSAASDAMIAGGAAGGRLLGQVADTVLVAAPARALATAGGTPPPLSGSPVAGRMMMAAAGEKAGAAVGSQGVGGASKGADLHRPYIRKRVRAEVEARAPRDASGRPIDPNTGAPIEGKPDLGHKYGHEFRREKAAAEAKGLTQKEFNDKMNDPDLYQLEDPSSNRSSKYEQKP